MESRKAHLPDYFPIGASYVVEGKNDAKGRLRVSARYVVFADGRRVDLPLRVVAAPPLAPRDVIGKRRDGKRPVARTRRDARTRASA